MDNILEEIMRQLKIATNQAAYAKLEAERGQQWGLDDTHGKAKQISLLANELDAAVDEFGRIKQFLFNLVDLIEDHVYSQELAALSPSNKGK